MTRQTLETTCPLCGARLVLRRDGPGREVVACSHAGCPFEGQVPTDLVMRRVGARCLPGFEQEAR